ncbi:hypothetical protein GCM10022198_10100 [Klugiella xanthotipulae]|uniref:Glycosyl transferase family 2 n=1 Tax=Klugiella xanthotipulae TaxID=244735 RepID=A0A543HYL2_9MICO|nr:glycosyltransferase family 2 protein [Klugiella xanthotipulae]TQM63408.1 glycosyl transferase family 2 [Klugiella xanthotipulae]
MALSSRRDGSDIHELSIVVTAHNVAHRVDECVMSVLHRNSLDCEIVLVDIGSTDGTAERLRALARADSRIRVFSGSLLGTDSPGATFSAMNLGGTYVAWVDGHDLVPPGAFSALLNSARTNRADAVVGAVLDFAATETWNSTEGYDIYEDSESGILLTNRLGLIVQRPGWHGLARRQVWQDHDSAFLSGETSARRIAAIRVLRAAESINVITTVVYLARTHYPTLPPSMAEPPRDRVLTYLREETAVARYVNGLDTPKLGETWWKFTVQTDVGRFLRDYVAALRAEKREIVDPEVARAVRGLVELAPTHVWETVPVAHRAVIVAVASGDYDAVAVTLENMKPTPQSRTDLNDLTRRVRAAVVIAQTGLLSVPSLTELYRRIVIHKRDISTEIFAAGDLEVVGRTLGMVESSSRRQPEWVSDLVLLTNFLATSHLTTIRVEVSRSFVHLVFALPPLLAGSPLTLVGYTREDSAHRVSLGPIVGLETGLFERRMTVSVDEFNRAGYWRILLELSSDAGTLARPLGVPSQIGADHSSNRSRGWPVIVASYGAQEKDLLLLRRSHVVIRVCRALIRRLRGWLH